MSDNGIGTVHLVLLSRFDPKKRPMGAIDFELTYRNHSLVLPSN